MNESFRQTLTDYILSGHAYLHAHTPEKTRFVQELKEVAAAAARRPAGLRLVAGDRLAGRRGRSRQD
jgi:hypothetical protein